MTADDASGAHPAGGARTDVGAEPAAAHVRAFAGTKQSGERVDELLHVEDLGDGRVRLLASPALVLGVAAGDTVALDEDGRVTVLARGGNLAVQVHAPPAVGDAVAAALAPLGGRCDVRHRLLTVLTVPVRAGFAAVEGAVTAALADHTGADWYYGNVYDDDGTTPLGWWETT